MAAKTYQPAGCDTDLSDAEWELLKPLIYPADAKRGRGRWRDPDSARACLDAIRYVLKTGCQWPLLSKEFAPKSTVHDSLATWTKQGLWLRIEVTGHQDTPDAKKRHAQRRCHRQPKRQGRATTADELLVRCRQEDPRGAQAPCARRHK